MQRHPKRVARRLPGEPEALAKTSNRTKPQEGHYISGMDGRAKRRQHQKKQIRAMSNSADQESGGWLENRGFGALDLASQKHSVVVVDPHGKVIEDFEIDHSALGWKKFRERMRLYGSIPFAIETSQGAAVEQLLEAGMQVYPLNPKSAQAYRERKAPSGVKDDRLDAWSFADALRVDGQNWKSLRPEGSLIKELRLLCRDEVGLIEQRTAFINQLRHALAEYYQTALEAFEDWGAMSAWMFLQRPRPTFWRRQASVSGKSSCIAASFGVTKAVHDDWNSSQMPPSSVAANPTKAKSMLALSLVKMLFALENQLSEYRKRIEELFESHPDHDLFGSLPGAGPKLAPRLLAEIGDDRERFEGDAQNLQCLAGTAPVTKRSGKHLECHQRWACNKYLRFAVHLFSEHTITRCAWAEIYYQAHRAKDHSHARALRCLGQRWLKIIHKMWMDRTPYNAELHHLNQVKHGSWVFQLKNT
jgi:transposase